MINYYLEELAADGGEIETEEELNEQKQVVEKVVDKLIYQDQVRILARFFAFLDNSFMLSPPSEKIMQ